MKRALFALLLACGGGGTRPKSAYDELEVRIPKMLTAMDQLAKDLAAVKDECEQIAAVLRKWGSQYAVELDALADLKAKLTAEERERYEHEHDEDARHVKPVLDASLDTCQGNTGVEDALKIAGFRRAETAK